MKFLLPLFFVFLLPSTSIAAGKNVWRDCGIGALIFSETKWAAVTSNIIWDLGITGSSSTSSSPGQCSGASTGEFIYKNYALLEEQAAIGEGTHLIAMLNMFGCEDSIHQNLIQDLRSDFSNSLSSPEYSKQNQMEKAENLYNKVVNQAEGKYRSSCRVI